MARTSLLLALTSASIALAQSTCPDGKKPGNVYYSGGGFDVCCPGAFGVGNGNGPHSAAITCTYGCSYPTQTVCGSTTLTDASTTLPTSAPPTITGSSSAAAASTTCSGASCLPPGCSAIVVYAHPSGLCSFADYFQPGYLSSVYGTLAGTNTFGAGPTGAMGPSSAMAARITDAPQMMAVAGALAGLVLL